MPLPFSSSIPNVGWQTRPRPTEKHMICASDSEADGPWYLTDWGLLTHDYSRAKRSQMKRRATFAKTNDPFDFLVVIDPTFDAAISSLPMINPLNAVWERQLDNTITQTRPLYFLVEGVNEVCLTAEKAHRLYRQQGDLEAAIIVTDEVDFVSGYIADLDREGNLIVTKDGNIVSGLDNIGDRVDPTHLQPPFQIAPRTSPSSNADQAPADDA
ncbi:hypothetical protein B0H11DRAFT_2225314 [Mycena galericulata]|nr:hypothetical protein B0H11DRAFT_1913576 [Mycena galericulata]KAJ7500925.1 hypothetical protein B0H11DRAFT_2225314 [Mycena galericulata]